MSVVWSAWIVLAAGALIFGQSTEDPPFRRADAAHPAAGLAYAVYEWCAHLSVAAVCVAGAPLVWAVVRAAWAQRRRSPVALMLLPVIVPPCFLVALVVIAQAVPRSAVPGVGVGARWFTVLVVLGLVAAALCAVGPALALRRVCPSPRSAAMGSARLGAGARAHGWLRGRLGALRARAGAVGPELRGRLRAPVVAAGALRPRDGSGVRDGGDEHPPGCPGDRDLDMSAVLSTEAVSKRFGRRLAVDGVSLEIGPGQAFGFLGPNGAGKTTLIRMLVGLTRPSAGTVCLFGRPLDDDRAAILARVGAIVEEPRFHLHISARQNLRLSAAARGRRADGRVDVCLERCGLLDRADDRVREYSLGMRQRLGLARCLLGDPELLILDEPTNGLDPAGMVEFRRFVRELVDEGRTVFISTHLLDEIEKICDFAAIVHDGRVVASGSILELTDSGGRSRLIVGTDRPADAIAAVTDLIESHRLISPGHARTGHGPAP